MSWAALRRGWLAAVLASMLVSAAAVSAHADPVLDLLTAARRGDITAIRKALAAGAPVNAADPEFAQTGLIRAAMFGQLASAEALLAAGAEPNKTSNLQRTALHWAATAGAAALVPLLARAGASLDAPDAYGETPLDYAAAAGQPETARALLAAGARVEKLAKPLASRFGLVLGNGLTGPALDVLLVIAATGHGLEIRDEASRQTALLAVADRAHQDPNGLVTTTLVKAGADRRATDGHGKTAAALIAEALNGQTNPDLRRNLLAAQQALH